MSREKAKKLFSPPIDTNGPWINDELFRELIDILYDDLDISFADSVFPEDKVEKALRESKSFADFKKRMLSD
jgi:hypothetical protein